MSSLSLAQSFVPAYRPLPSYLRLNSVVISPRTPRNGSSAALPASGTTGVAGTITPARSVVEAQNWGADYAAWCYVSAATSNGYASASAFVAEFTAAGIPVQGTTNTSPVNPTTGPFMQDLAGNDWSIANNNPLRPLLSVGGPQNPLYQHTAISIGYMPAADPTNTQAPKLADIATQQAAGIQGLHMDDPRGPAAFAGARGIDAAGDTNSQGVDFSATARAGFTAWLVANTTAAQRTAVGLPTNLSGFDIKNWLITNYSSILYGANQVDPAAIDNYLFRTNIRNSEALRTVITTWLGRFLRDDHASYVAQVKAQLGSAPLTFNAFNVSPMELLNWIGRQVPQSFDLAVAETAPPYWQDLSAHTVGSAAFLAVREAQCARQHMNSVMCDFMGLRAMFEHKPTAPNAAPARVLKQLLRQSIMQSVMEGSIPIIPIDVFLTTSDEKSQGVDVDGYRFWGSTADYKDCFDFIKANGSLLNGFEKVAAVHVAVHSESWPFYAGSPSNTKFYGLMSRLAELWKRDVDYHFVIAGSAEGLLPTDPPSVIESSAPLVLRLQDDADYYTHLGRFSGPTYRKWSTAACDEAARYSPVRSSNPNVRATVRRNPTTGSVSVHLHNYALNADGTPNPQTTTLFWRWGGAGQATVTRLGEAPSTVDLSRGYAMVTQREYAIVNFAA